MDLYRLSSADEFVMLGTEDFLGIDGVTIIEWSEKAEDELPPENLITITITLEGDHTRRFVIAGPKI